MAVKKKKTGLTAAQKKAGVAKAKRKIATHKAASKKKRNTTSKDVPGSGLAKRAATAIEKRRKMLRNI
jgi:hypothetical protein